MHKFFIGSLLITLSMNSMASNAGFECHAEYEGISQEKSTFTHEDEYFGSLNEDGTLSVEFKGYVYKKGQAQPAMYNTGFDLKTLSPLSKTHSVTYQISRKGPYLAQNSWLVFPAQAFKLPKGSPFQVTYKYESEVMTGIGIQTLDCIVIN